MHQRFAYMSHFHSNSEEFRFNFNQFFSSFSYNHLKVHSVIFQRGGQLFAFLTKINLQKKKTNIEWKLWNFDRYIPQKLEFSFHEFSSRKMHRNTATNCFILLLLRPLALRISMSYKWNKKSVRLREQHNKHLHG